MLRHRLVHSPRPSVDRRRGRRQSCGRDDRRAPRTGHGEPHVGSGEPVSGRPTPATAARGRASPGAATACRRRAPGPRPGSSASSRQPSRSTQSASGRDGGRRGDPDRRLLHAAEERPEPELAGALEHPPGRADAAALRELHVDAGDDPDQRVEVVDRHGALVGDQRQRRPGLERAQLVEAARRVRAARSAPRPAAASSGSSAARLFGRPARVGVDPDRAARRRRAPPRASRCRTDRPP